MLSRAVYMGRPILYASTTRQAEWSGPKRYLRIVIHENREFFYDYLNYEVASTTLACFQPARRREKFDEDKGEWVNLTNKHYGGTIHLIDGWIQHGIVAHECVHAAAHIWRMDVQDEIMLGDNCGYREEGFAYLVGDLVQGVMNAIFEWEISEER